MEELRTTESNLALGCSFWATMSLPPQGEKEMTPQMVHIRSQQSEYVRISRSQRQIFKCCKENK